MERVQVQHTVTFADITRPDDAVQYAAGEVVSDSITAATAMKFNRCSSEPGRGGSVRSVVLVDSINAGTKLNADLFLFSVAPVTFGNDNEAFVPTDAELQTCIGVVSLDGTTAANTKIGSGNLAIQSQGLDLPFTCADTDSALYGVLVARNTYTPTALEAFRVKLGVQQG